MALYKSTFYLLVYFLLIITRSHGSVSVVRTTVKVNGKWQNLTLSRR